MEGLCQVADSLNVHHVCKRGFTNRAHSSLGGQSFDNRPVAESWGDVGVGHDLAWESDRVLLPGRGLQAGCGNNGGVSWLASELAG
eukprot:1351855-Rhodomonas_salina.1